MKHDIFIGKSRKSKFFLDHQIFRKYFNKIIDILKYLVYKIVKSKYMLSLPYCYLAYSPWLEEWFQEIYNKVKNITLVTDDKCYIIYEFCRHCLHLEGDFAECGVYKGGSAFLIAYVLKNFSTSERQLHLFDTFTGMPAMANIDVCGYKEGDFGDVSLDVVKGHLKAFPFVMYHPGIIPKTFGTVKNKKFVFVHIDVDLYQTTKDCCSFFYDRMISGGVMIFDDYGLARYKSSEKKAVDDFFHDKPERLMSLPTGQCIVIKL